MAETETETSVPLHQSCRDCEHWATVRDQIRIANVLEKMIAKMEVALTDEKFKATTGDFIKLIQLQKEFEQDELKEISVTWIEPKRDEEAVTGK